MCSLSVAAGEEAENQWQGKDSQQMLVLLYTGKEGSDLSSVSGWEKDWRGTEGVLKHSCVRHKRS